MKLFIYAGEAINLIMPSGCKRDCPAKSNLLEDHKDLIDEINAHKAYLPEDGTTPITQVKLVESMLDRNKENNRDVMIFTHSPYVLDMAYQYGKKLGYEIKAFHVIFKDGDRSEAKFEDPVCESTSGTLEKIWGFFNSGSDYVDNIHMR